MKLVKQLLITMAISGVLFCQSLSAQQAPSAASAQTHSGTAKTVSSLDQENTWHIDLSPYLWFSGAHGRVGALEHDVSVHASPGDLLEHFDMGLMGAAEARYNRFVLNGNLQWLRISDNQPLPIPTPTTIFSDVRVGQLVWTSKVGYRLVDHESVKLDANLGVRFWHLGQTLNFNPSPDGFSFNGSHNWADILVGGRIVVPAGKKAEITLVGDVGGWNATSKLDYAFTTLLGYKVSSRWTLLAGYGYQFVDYRPGPSSVFNVVASGALVGLTYHLK